jgi:alpha-beta hydrolase superfamily lysophospholipase
MIPLYVGGCFAVLHPARGRRAALICGSLGDEALNAYRSLVLLADLLAAADIPTLRLSYRGTGDSAGTDYETGRFQQWIDSIRAAVDWLRDDCGAGAVTVIGHRIGASLAAHAAGDSEVVDSLVLLGAIGGRQLLHELTVAARISQRVWQTSHKVDDGAWFEAAGLRLDRATRDALNGLDLRKLAVQPAARALVLEPERRPATAPLREALERLDVAVAFEAHPGLERMLRDSYAASIPASAIDSVARWMRALPTPDRTFSAPATIDGSLDVGATREKPIRFGPDEGCFGILATPERIAPRGPAVLILNTSANPRWGNARLAVDLARTFAADGLPSLRMDAGGMGDAAVATGAVGRPYSQSVTEDALHAAVELERQTGRPVVIFGFCSGAYHALQAAFHDPVIHGLMLVNLPRFLWREGDPPDTERQSDLRPTRFYLRNLIRAQAWFRLLRGDFDVVNLLRVLTLRVLRRVVVAVEPLLGASTTRVGRVRLAMQELARRNVPVLYVLGRNDPGVEELAAYFGSDGWRLRRQPNVTMHTLEDADHTLAAEPVRAALIRCIRAWSRDNWSTVEARPDRAGWMAEPVRIRARTPLGALFRRTSVHGR